MNGEKANCNGAYPCGTRTKGECLNRTTEVGAYAANPWGLYDMHGNVFEWCEDLYAAYENVNFARNPVNTTHGSSRVMRGGCWYGYAKYCRSAYRGNGDPTNRSNYFGFRLVLVCER